MNRAAGILLLMLALAALRALLPVLLVALLLALAYSLITQPRETLAFVALSALGSVVSARPGLAIGAFVLVWVTTLVTSRKLDSAGQPLLPGPCEHHSN
jgi:hypothetical protein